MSAMLFLRYLTIILRSLIGDCQLTKWLYSRGRQGSIIIKWSIAVTAGDSKLPYCYGFLVVSWHILILLGTGMQVPCWTPGIHLDWPISITSQASGDNSGVWREKVSPVLPPSVWEWASTRVPAGEEGSKVNTSQTLQVKTEGTSYYWNKTISGKNRNMN